jgi:hypothetical protein
MLAAPVLACTDPPINGGTFEFEYAQFPSGPINGSFLSTGSVVLDPVNEGTASATFELDGVQYLVVVGAVEDGATFTDVGVIIVRGAVPPGPGVYAFDGSTAFFVFADDVVGYDTPLDLCAVNWTNELANAVALGKHVSMTGSVTVLTTGATVSGTFAGTTLDPDTGAVLSVTEGAFNVEDTTSLEPSAWSRIKADYR